MRLCFSTKKKKELPLPMLIHYRMEYLYELNTPLRLRYNSNKRHIDWIRLLFDDRSRIQDTHYFANDKLLTQMIGELDSCYNFNFFWPMKPCECHVN